MCSTLDPANDHRLSRPNPLVNPTTARAAGGSCGDVDADTRGPSHPETAGAIALLPKWQFNGRNNAKEGVSLVTGVELDRES